MTDEALAFTPIIIVWATFFFVLWKVGGCKGKLFGSYYDYEKIKNGTFRYCVFLTILLEISTIFTQKQGRYGGSTKLFGSYYDDEALAFTPIIIWATFFFILWIVRGYMGKK